jgi:hypothetical protein
MEITPDDVERLSECSSGQFIEIRTLSSGCRSILQGLAENSADWHCLHSLNAGNVLNVERLIVGQAVSFSRHESGIPKALKPNMGCQCRAEYLPDGSMGWFHLDGTPCNCERLPFEGRVVPIASIRITAIGAELLDSKGKDTDPKSSKRDKTQKRWTVQDVEDRIRLELKSSDAAAHEKYLFATADELQVLIGCGRKTAMNTPFWMQDREELQKEWRRKNSKGQRPREQDF